MLKRYLLNMLLPALVVLPGTTALAADTASVKVTGKVVASACTVDTGLGSGKTVDLGTLGRTKFQFAGNAGEWADFSLNLTDCPQGTTRSIVTFTGDADGDDATLFANTEPGSGAASNVAIQLTKGDDHNAVLSNNSTLEAAVDTGRNIIFPLSARLITPTGGTQPGKVSGTVMVNFAYP